MLAQRTNPITNIPSRSSFLTPRRVLNLLPSANAKTTSGKREEVVEAGAVVVPPKCHCAQSHPSSKVRSSQLQFQKENIPAP
ncbi:hypothetical protein DV515_00018095, partial [Chloebia gouldiae]